MEKNFYDLTEPQKSIWLTEQYCKNTSISDVCGSLFLKEKQMAGRTTNVKEELAKKAEVTKQFHWKSMVSPVQLSRDANSGPITAGTHTGRLIDN